MNAPKDRTCPRCGDTVISGLVPDGRILGICGHFWTEAPPAACAMRADLAAAQAIRDAAKEHLKARVRTMRADGVSVREIAREMDLSRATVMAWVKQAKKEAKP